jgi:hypothetical protein
MPKRFLVLDLATGAVDAAITTAMQAAIAASAASNIIKITVDDEAARYALTVPQVQNGDFVYQTDTATLYEVIDQTLLNGAAGYVALATVTAAQISDATASGRALLTGNVSIGSGSDSVTLQTSGNTQIQLPTSGRLGTSSVLLTNHQTLNGATLVTGVKYAVRQDGYNSAYAYLPTDATTGDVIELADIEGQWGRYSFTLYASNQYLNDNWYGGLICAAAFSRVRALYRGNGYWTVLVDDPGKFTNISWDGNSSLYPVAGNRWSMTYPASYSIYLPSGASQGDEILIRDGGSNWGSYGIWLYGNSTYLNGSWAGSFYSNTSGATIRCVYGYDSSIGQLGWKVALVVSTGDPVWTEDSSATNYFYAQAGQRFVFTYTPPGDALYTYLPSSPAVGDEIWIADGGRNWSLYPLVISATTPTNGNWTGFSTSTRWALVRCVYLGGSIGWSITEFGVARDAWQTAAGGSLYPSPGDRLDLIYSGTPTVYLPSSASEGDEILIRDGGNHWGNYGVNISGNNTYLNGQWYGTFYSSASGATIRCVYGYDSALGVTGWIVGLGSTESWVKVSDSTQRVFSGCKYLYAPMSGGLVNLPHGYSWQRKPGDEIWLADPGQNWGAFPIYIQMPNGSYGGGGDVINGAAVPFYVDRPGGKIRCVYVDDYTGWSVAYADEGRWRSGIDDSLMLYPNGRYSCAFSSARTLTLPRPDYQNLQPGDEILIEDAGIAGTNGWATHTLTIDNNSQNVNGTPTSRTVTTNGATVRCVWVGGGTGWSVKTLPGFVI